MSTDACTPTPGKPYNIKGKTDDTGSADCFGYRYISPTDKPLSDKDNYNIRPEANYWVYGSDCSNVTLTKFYFQRAYKDAWYIRDSPATDFPAAANGFYLGGLTAADGTPIMGVNYAYDMNNYPGMTYVWTIINAATPGSCSFIANDVTGPATDLGFTSRIIPLYETDTAILQKYQGAANQTFSLIPQ